jgi:ribosomal protein S1
MSESLPDPRLQSLINKLRPGPVRSVTVAGFDGADVLVFLRESDEEGDTLGRIPRHEASIRRVDHPSEIFEIGQPIEADVRDARKLK